MPTPSEPVLLAFYQAARAELVERIRLRDAIFLGYSSAMLVGFSVPEGSRFQQGFLLAVPFFSLTVACVLTAHLTTTRRLAEYIAFELGPQLNGRGWDHSKTWEVAKKDNWFRVPACTLAATSLANVTAIWRYIDAENVIMPWTPNRSEYLHGAHFLSLMAVTVASILSLWILANEARNRRSEVRVDRPSNAQAASSPKISALIAVALVGFIVGASTSLGTALHGRAKRD